MAFTDPFGDFSDNYQRHGNIPTGGMAIECGCITAAADTTFYVPTKMAECYCVVLDSDDGTDTVATTAVPCVSDGYIKCAMTGALSNGYNNYMAVGN